MRKPLLCLLTLMIGGLLAPPAAGALPHTVVEGETLWSIAAANNFTTRALAAANGLSEDAQVVLGSTIQIPSEVEGAAALAATGQSDLQSTETEQAATQTAQSGSEEKDPNLNLDPASSVHPHPTNEQVSADQVGAVAAPQGVAPSLAKSVAWQESGFNNAAVSSTGARGVMQIMPPTWEWIDENLAQGPLDAASAHDNIRAGAMYLNYLRRATGDEKTALASYYQGLDSVRRDGLRPETELYVDAVSAHEANRFGGP